MKKTKFIVLLIGLISFALLSHFFLQNNFHSRVRYINDNFDRGNYYDRGSWYPLKKVPYLEVFSEYPQIATYFFALPHAFLSALYGSNYSRQQYYLVFSILMMIFLFISILLLYKLRIKNKDFAFLMLLPASLYFSHNRYDIIPVFLSILSIKLLSREKYNLSIIILALGVMTKWYLILLFPIFLNFYYSKQKKINWNMIFTFCLTIIICILPTLFSGGMEALLAPYKLHIGRGFNNESLFYLLKIFLNNTLNINIETQVGYLFFFVLQLSVIPLLFIKKINTLPKVANWSALTILVFLLFAKFYSPQWILWAIPFLILRIQKMSDIILVITFDVVTYLYFPVVFDGYKDWLDTIIIIKTVVLICLIIIISKNLFSRH